MFMNAIRVCGNLFVSILLLSSISEATNFFERHGNNFIYLDSSGVESILWRGLDYCNAAGRVMKTVYIIYYS
ncbi:MAG: hypothetical protein AVO35_09610 [Candidatus Aegiribacteria sp. MLS_C]|nr:MAG: hypothetical protein AVO35_09610 [Candidatus Aegiribacteria sp. MLS_C]